MLPPSLIRDLATRRADAPVDDVERNQQAFVLTAGLGPRMYLTRDGRVLVGADPFWDEARVREATPDERATALVAGARRLQLPALLELIAPPGGPSIECTVCHGARWDSRFLAASGETDVVVCRECFGRGWVAAQAQSGDQSAAS
jgi:hypothetical protein